MREGAVMFRAHPRSEARAVRQEPAALSESKGPKHKKLACTSPFPQYLQAFMNTSRASHVGTRRGVPVTSVAVKFKLGGNAIMLKSACVTAPVRGSCETGLMTLDVGTMLNQFCGRLVQSLHWTARWAIRHCTSLRRQRQHHLAAAGLQSHSAMVQRKRPCGGHQVLLQVGELPVTTQRAQSETGSILSVRVLCQTHDGHHGPQG